ncbi:hypothetical protein CHELA1G11_14419 [Hyphomicrobiales bacterium]|nr:hypothetical protein CHELA1G11_14419 [Hyphomicrobiales bacterium]CAH1680255.1 hypothetical protein CHELA1G2_14673 [Hyphomicrobiales bacterium]
MVVDRNIQRILHFRASWRFFAIVLFNESLQCGRICAIRIAKSYPSIYWVIEAEEYWPR